MTMPRDLLLRNLSDLEPILRAEGVTRLGLFGSRAREDNRPDSDVDVVIDVAADRKFSLIDLVGVAHDIEDKVALPANVFMRRSLSEDFLKTLDRDEIGVFR